MLKSVSKLARERRSVVVAALVSFSPARAVPVNVTYNMTYAFFSPAAGTTVLQGTGLADREFANGTPGGHARPGRCTS